MGYLPKLLSILMLLLFAAYGPGHRRSHSHTPGPQADQPLQQAVGRRTGRRSEACLGPLCRLRQTCAAKTTAASASRPGVLQPGTRHRPTPFHPQPGEHHHPPPPGEEDPGALHVPCAPLRPASLQTPGGR